MRGELRTMTLVWIAISLVGIGGNPYRCDADGDTLHSPVVGPTSGAPPSQLAPVVVTATRSDTPLRQIPANVTVFSHEDIEQSPALAPDDFLREIPGFTTFRRSSSLVTAPAQDPEAQGVTLRSIGPGGVLLQELG
jgi:outer membrane receptor protein involved in Fe transport